MNKLLARCPILFTIFFLALMSGRAATALVTISGQTFVPTILTITNGDTVIWTNANNTHTISPRPGVSESFCGGFTTNWCSYTFTSAGSFAYRCNIHEFLNMTGQVIVVQGPGGTPPAITITNPLNNALFAAPATVPVGVSASDSDGTVVSVELLTNGVTATNATAPFAITLGKLAAGNYTLRARATDNEALSTLSAPVNIRVANRPALIFEPGNGGPLQFRFHTVAGVNYVVEGTTALTNFSPIVTNAGNGATQQFTQPNPAPSQRFFRLQLQ